MSQGANGNKENTNETWQILRRLFVQDANVSEENIGVQFHDSLCQHFRAPLWTIWCTQHGTLNRHCIGNVWRLNVRENKYQLDTEFLNDWWNPKAKSMSPKWWKKYAFTALSFITGMHQLMQSDDIKGTLWHSRTNEYQHILNINKYLNNEVFCRFSKLSTTLEWARTLKKYISNALCFAVPAGPLAQT